MFKKYIKVDELYMSQFLSKLQEYIFSLDIICFSKDKK